MAVATIVGAGLMGSAMAWPLSDNGFEVRLVGTHLDEETIESCTRSGFHPRLKRALPPRVRPFRFREIDRAVKGSDIVVSGVNSFGVQWIAEQLADRVRPGQKVISVTKGLHVDGDGTVRTFPELIAARFAPAVRASVPVAAVGGPCIAGELAGRRQTCVVFGCTDVAAARDLARCFATSYYHVWPTTDLLSLEISVALKNAYTVAVAYGYGALEKQGGPDDAGASMHNLASAMFAQSTCEIGALLARLGGNPAFATALPGAGDLYVTSMGGRTSRLGRLLGEGKSFDEARALMQGETLEAVEIIRAMAHLLPHLERRGTAGRDEFPLMRMLIALMGGAIAGEPPLDTFFQGVFSPRA